MEDKTNNLVTVGTMQFKSSDPFSNYPEKFESLKPFIRDFFTILKRIKSYESIREALVREYSNLQDEQSLKSVGMSVFLICKLSFETSVTVELASLYITDKNAWNIQRLIKEFRKIAISEGQNMDCFLSKENNKEIPLSETTVLKNIQAEYKKAASNIDALRQARNKSIAHLDPEYFGTENNAYQDHGIDNKLITDLLRTATYICSHIHNFISGTSISIDYFGLNAEAKILAKAIVNLHALSIK